MKYSLCDLNEKTNLEDLKTNEIINKLNLVGFEVDEINIDQKKYNQFITNINLLLKIPANRDDLLVEKTLIEDLNSLLLKKPYNFWNKIKNNYNSILLQKYNEHHPFKKIRLDNSMKNCIIYNIKIINNTNEIRLNSPVWIQEKLKNIGLEIKNNVEDIINLVNFEWGHHYFIINKNEEFNNTHSLNKENINNLNLVINDYKIKLSNELSKNYQFVEEFIIQGLFYDIYENPTNFNLQCNNENKKLTRTLRKSFKEHFRNSFNRLLTLFEVCTNFSICSDIYVSDQENIIIKTKKILKLKKKLSKTFLNLTNFDLNIFKEANLKIVCSSLEYLYFEIPLLRNDLNREIDLIEEYSRFIGYKNFLEIFPSKELFFYKNKEEHIELTRSFLSNYGFNEIITNPLVNCTNFQKDSVLLTNPLNSELSILRKDFLSSIINVFENNLRLSLGLESKNYYEIGRTFKIKNSQIFEMDKLAGIYQLKRIKKSQSDSIEWFIAKGLIENFLSYFGNFIFEKNNSTNLTLSLFHSTKTVLIKLNDNIIGIFGELNPKIQKSFNSKFNTYLFEINLNYLKNFKENIKIEQYKEFSKYPFIIKDISILVKKDLNLFQLESTIKSVDKEIKEIKFFDIYFNEENNSYINIGIRLKFQSFTKTLNAIDIDIKMEKILAILPSQ